MTLAYDTETTGMVLFSERSTHPDQPHLVELGMVIYDAAGVELTARSVLIRPDGWTVPPEMTAIHGITHERAMTEGIPEAHAVGLWFLALGKTSLRIAFQEQFDRRVMRIAALRAGYARDFIDLMEARPFNDPIRKARAHVGAIDKIGRGKAPKLSECVQHFFGEKLIGAHSALVDARACGRVYWHMQAMETVA